VFISEDQDITSVPPSYWEWADHIHIALLKRRYWYAIRDSDSTFLLGLILRTRDTQEGRWGDVMRSGLQFIQELFILLKIRIFIIYTISEVINDMPEVDVAPLNMEM
jgi:hypothetical protein